MKLIKLAILFLGLVFMGGCNKAKNYANNFINRQVEKVIPTFDAYVPDTQYNLKRFEEFFGFTPTADVQNIYCYANEIGIDQRYAFAFSCDSTSAFKICHHLNLVNDSVYAVDLSGFYPNFNWWSEEHIVELTPYWRLAEHQVHYFLWYDQATKQAYYLEFDL